MRVLILSIISLLVLSQHTCSRYRPIAANEVPVSAEREVLKEGWWLMKMDLGKDKLPVRFSYNKSTNSITIYNAEEKIVCEPVVIKGDSLFFKAPVFQNEFRMKITNASSVTGYWYNLNRTDYKIACSASFHSPENTSIIKGDPTQEKYEVHFSSMTSDEYNAIGLFNMFPSIDLHNAKYTPVTGTFMTETGDYRFLEGKLVNGELTLSCFDGSHAFLFKAKYNTTNDTLKGVFYSGNHFSEPWIAWRNKSAKLRNPDSLTTLNPGYESLAFSFPSLKNETINFPSERFKGKVTIVEIMGSWCPNCMDETVFLQSINEKYKNKGLEIVALCYERTSDFNKSVQSVTKMKESLGATYEFLIAGTSNKQKAAETLPMLSSIYSFPTTVFIDKKGKVRKIFTGYYGPSTGSYHKMYMEHTENFIQSLLNE